MAKLKKQPRYSAPPSTDSALLPASPSSSTSSPLHPAPSSAGSLPRSHSLKKGLRSSPIALRTAARPVLAAVSVQEARGVVDVEGSVQGAGRDVSVRSRSATRSSASSMRALSPTSLHRLSPTHSRSHTHTSSSSHEQDRPRTPTQAHTSHHPHLEPTVPDSPNDPFYSPSLSASPSVSGSGSAFSALRHSLDSDKVAREAKKVREEYEAHAAGRLRKRLPEKVVERKVEETLAHEVEEEEEVQHQEEEERMQQEAQAAVDEGVQTDEEEGVNGHEVESEELLDEAVQVDLAPPPAESATPSDSPSPSSSFFLLPLVVSPTALILASARLTYTLTSRTLLLSLSTSANVLRRVPVAGRLLPPPAAPTPPPSLATTSAQNGTPAAFPTPPSSSSPGPSFALAVRPAASSATSLSTSPSAAENPSSLRASVAQRLGVEEDKLPSSISEALYTSAEIGLGLGLAGVLVGVAVGGMAWDRVFGRRATGREGKAV
ncbi:hypothetical protein JCM11251_003549 [Rhodosporidiobolus azoricus]